MRDETTSDERATASHYVAEISQRAILFDDEDRALMVQYDADHEWWSFPGGRLHEGESPKDGLRREVREETGLSVEVVQPIATRSFEWDGESKFGIAYLCRLSDGADPEEVELSDEHRGYRWVEPGEISELDTPSDDQRVALAKARQMRAR